jgi:hypothetical protein
MGTAAVILVAIFAAVSGAALVWWVLHQTDQPVTATVAPAELSVQQPAQNQEPPPVSEANDLAPATEVAPTAIVDQPVDQTVAPPTPLPTESEGQPSPTAAPEPDSPTPKPVVRKNGDRVFVLDADLGTVKLSLGYIVARSTNPFAEINGIEVLVGSEIEGFTVEAIEANRVTLRDANGLLVLKVP